MHSLVMVSSLTSPRKRKEYQQVSQTHGICGWEKDPVPGCQRSESFRQQCIHPCAGPGKAATGTVSQSLYSPQEFSSGDLTSLVGPPPTPPLE